MKIDTKKQILNLRGEPIKGPEGEDYTYGQALSNVLLESKKGGKMKMFVLAQACFTKDFVEIDIADRALIKDALQESEMPTLVCGQLLQYVDELKDKKNGEK